jgi:hypothetical protein
MRTSLIHKKMDRGSVECKKERWWVAVGVILGVALICVAVLNSSHEAERQELLGPRRISAYSWGSQCFGYKMSPRDCADSAVDRRSGLTSREMARQIERSKMIMKRERKISNYVMTEQKLFRLEFLKNETKKRNDVLACSQSPEMSALLSENYTLYLIKYERCWRKQEAYYQDVQQRSSDRAINIWLDTEQHAAGWRKLPARLQ